MKFVVDNEVLEEGLKRISKAVPIKTNMEILRNIVLEATSDNMISLTAFNSVFVMNTIIEAKVLEEGKVLIPYRDLFIFTSRSDEPITIKTENNTIFLESKSIMELATIDIEQFPDLPQFPSEYSYQIDFLSDKIKKTINTVIKDGNSQFSGILFSDNYIVSTDSNRLSYVQCDLNIEPIIIPFTTLLAMSNWETVQLTKEKNMIYFKYHNTILGSRLTLTKFPDVTKVISLNNEYSFKINKEEFLNICEKSSIIDKETLTLTFNDNILTFNSSRENGKFNDYIELDKQINEEIKIILNPQFLIEGIKVMDEDEFIFEISNRPNNPIIIKSNNYKYILMPKIR